MSGYAERTGAREFFRNLGQPPRLPALDLELTERCNSDCVHCCISLPANDRGALEAEMGAAEIKRILGEAAQLGCLEVRYTGGEPLLRADFEELYLSARRLGMRVLVFTNARLISPRLADLFVRVPPLVPIEVSVYGMRAETYEAVTRVPGSFAQFRRGVELLAAQRVPFVVKSALMPENREDLAVFERWAGEIEWMTGRPQVAMCFDLRHRRDSVARNERIRAARSSPEEAAAVLGRDAAAYRLEMAEFCAKYSRPAGDRLFRCGAGRSVAIDAYGRCQPCLALRAPELSFDLRQGKLAEALEFFSGLAEMRSANPEYIGRCGRCFLKGLCEQCAAKSWMGSGTLDTPDEYLCRVAHAQARRLGLIREDEQAWNLVDYAPRLRILANEAAAATGPKGHRSTEDTCPRNNGASRN